MEKHVASSVPSKTAIPVEFMRLKYLSLLQRFAGYFRHYRELALMCTDFGGIDSSSEFMASFHSNTRRPKRPHRNERFGIGSTHALSEVVAHPEAHGLIAISSLINGLSSTVITSLEPLKVALIHTSHRDHATAAICLALFLLPQYFWHPR
jgi:hypothetical protein